MSGIDDTVERVRAAILYRLGSKAYLSRKGLIQAIADESNLSGLSVRQAFARLAKAGWLEGVAPDGTPIGHIKVTGPVPKPPTDPALERWLAAIDAADLPEQDRKAILPLASRLADCLHEDLVHVAEGLIRLRAALPDEEGRHHFLVSARYLLGSSKLLDALGGHALKTFGIDVACFTSHPLYVVVAGAEKPKTVVLVENPAAFELAVSSSAIQHCAFVATFGFGLSKSQEDYGNQLAGMVEDRFVHAITLRREGATCPDAGTLLTHPNVTFWGDLDPAGIEIYLRLKKSIPKLQLSALYEPMAKCVKNSKRSHPYVQSTRKEGQSSMSRTAAPGVETAALLIDLCATRGVDQETVTITEIEAHAQSVLLLSQVSGLSTA